MKQFNDLPLELQSEILIHNPKYLTINKKLDKHTFYQEYCDLPISVNEFINYFIKQNKTPCIIYSNNIDEEDLPEFTVHIIHEDHVDVHMLFIDNTDEDEFIVNTITMSYIPYNNIKDYINSFNYNVIYYDVKTTFNILKNRNCESIKPGYAYMMTMKIVNYYTPKINVDNLYSFFDECKKILYMTTNYDLLIGQDIKNILNTMRLEDILFNSQGDMISDDDVIQHAIENTKFNNVQKEITDLILLL
jgi:hypothetical protein